MNCPNCGRPLAEGEVCTCTQQAQPVQPAPMVDPAQAQQVYYQQAPVAPAVKPAPSTDYPEGYKPKKKSIALILGIMFGAFGAMDFYLGYKTNGIIKVIIATVGNILFGLGLLAMSIWNIIDVIMLLVEAKNADANNYKIMTIEEAVARELKKEQ